MSGFNQDPKKHSLIQKMIQASFDYPINSNPDLKQSTALPKETQKSSFGKAQDSKDQHDSQAEEESKDYKSAHSNSMHTD